MVRRASKTALRVLVLACGAWLFILGPRDLGMAQGPVVPITCCASNNVTGHAAAPALATATVARIAGSSARIGAALRAATTPAARNMRWIAGVTASGLTATL